MSVNKYSEMAAYHQHNITIHRDQRWSQNSQSIGRYLVDPRQSLKTRNKCRSTSWIFEPTNIWNMSKSNTNQSQQQRQHADSKFPYSGKFLALILIVGLAWATPASADSLTEAMRASTVPVVCAVSLSNLGTGSGFLVADGKHVVTNRHVVACTDESGKVGIMAANGELIQAAVLWQSAAKDLAILRVEKNPVGQVVSFATRSAMDERDKVIVAGYPGAALHSTRDFGRVSFAEGFISKFTELDSPEGTVKHIQITAPAIRAGHCSMKLDRWWALTCKSL